MTSVVEQPASSSLPLPPIRQPAGTLPLMTAEDPISLWLKLGALEKLEQAVLDGYGELLNGKTSRIPQVNKFLRQVPAFQAKINEIHRAIVAGHLREVQHLIDRKKLAFCRDPVGASPLHKAVLHGQKDIVVYLLERYGSVIHTRDHQGRTPLHYAAVLPDNGEIYQILLEGGADDRATDVYGQKPDYYLNTPGELTMDQLLEGAIVNQIKRVKPKNHKMNRASEQRGISAKPAVSKGHIRELLSQSEVSPLEEVMLQGHGEKLIGESATDATVSQFLDKVPKLLEEISELHRATGRGRQDEVEQKLKESPALAMARDQLGATPLHKAVLYGHTQIAQLLAQAHPATLNAKDVDGRTPLHYAAVLKDNRDMYYTLLNCGASNQIPDVKGRTPDHYVTFPDQLSLEQLIKRSQRVNATYNANTTTRHFKSRSPLTKSSSEGENLKALANGEGSESLDDEQQSVDSTQTRYQHRYYQPSRRARYRSRPPLPPPRLQRLEVNSANIRKWIQEEDLEKLEGAVLQGFADKVVREQPGVDPSSGLQHYISQEVPQLVERIRAIHSAVSKDDLSVLQEQLAKEDYALAKDHLGMTPVHRAVILGRREALMFLIRKFPETVNARDKDGRTALHYAAAKTRKDGFNTYKALVDAGADPSIRDQRGRSPEFYKTHHLSIPSGMSSKMRVALNHRRSQSEPPLERKQATAPPAVQEKITVALKTGDLGQLQELVLDGWGHYLMGRSSWYDNVKTYLKTLPPYLASIRAFQEACASGDLETVQNLSSADESLLKARNQDSLTGVHIAVLNNQLEVVKHLTTTFPSTLSIKDGSGKTALHLSGTSNNPEIYKMLLESGADVKIFDQRGKTPDYYMAIHDKSFAKAISGKKPRPKKSEEKSENGDDDGSTAAAIALGVTIAAGAAIAAGVVIADALSDEACPSDEVTTEQLGEDPEEPEANAEEVAAVEDTTLEVSNSAEDEVNETTATEEAKMKEGVTEEVAGEEDLSNETAGEEIAREEAEGEGTVEEEGAADAAEEEAATEEVLTEFSTEEEVTANETTTEDAAAEEASAEEATTEEGIAEQTEAQEVAEEEAAEEEAAIEEASAEDVAGEEDAATGVTEETVAEEDTAVEAATEEVAVEQVATEEDASEEDASEEAAAEEAAAEEAAEEEAAEEEAAEEEAAEEEAAEEGAAAEEAAAEEAAAEEAAAEEAAAEEAAAEEAAEEENTTEEATEEEAAAEEAETEVSTAEETAAEEPASEEPSLEEATAATEEAVIEETAIEDAEIEAIISNDTEMKETDTEESATEEVNLDEDDSGKVPGDDGLADESVTGEDSAVKEPDMLQNTLAEEAEEEAAAGETKTDLVVTDTSVEIENSVSELDLLNIDGENISLVNESDEGIANVYNEGADANEDNEISQTVIVEDDVIGENDVGTVSDGAQEAAETVLEFQAPEESVDSGVASDSGQKNDDAEDESVVEIDASVIIVSDSEALVEAEQSVSASENDIESTIVRENDEIFESVETVINEKPPSSDEVQQENDLNNEAELQSDQTKENNVEIATDFVQIIEETIVVIPDTGENVENVYDALKTEEEQPEIDSNPNEGIEEESSVENSSAVDQPDNTEVDANALEADETVQLAEDESAPNTESELNINEPTETADMVDSETLGNDEVINIPDVNENAVSSEPSEEDKDEPNNETKFEESQENGEKVDDENAETEVDIVLADGETDNIEDSSNPKDEANDDTGDISDELLEKGDGETEPRSDSSGSDRLGELIDKWIEERDLLRLEHVVIAGQGDRLVGRISQDKQVSEFLNLVPTYMERIRTVHDAVVRGNLSEVHAVLTRKRFALSRDQMGASPLHLAVLHGHTEVMIYILQQFPETLNGPDNEGRTPFHYSAVLRDGGQCYNILKNAGADPNIKDKLGLTPEHYLEHPEELTVRELLQNYRLLNRQPSSVDLWQRPPTAEIMKRLTPPAEGGSITPFSAREEDSEDPSGKSKEQREEVVALVGSILQEHFVEDPQYPDQLGEALTNGLTRLSHYRPQDPIGYMATWLLQYASNHTKKEEPPTRRTSSGGRVGTPYPDGMRRTVMDSSRMSSLGDGLVNSIQSESSLSSRRTPVFMDEDLPEEDTDLPLDFEDHTKLKDEEGQTVLHLAALQRQPSEALYATIAQTEMLLGEKDGAYRTAREAALEAGLQENANTFDRYILDAYKEQRVSLLQLLQHEGYDRLTTVPDPNGEQLMSYLTANHLSDMVTLLQDCIEYQTTREELQTLIRHGCLEAVESIVSKDHSLVTAKNSRGRCSLHVAVLFSNLDIIQSLVNHNASAIHVPDHLGRTPLHYCMAMENVDTVGRILIKAGALRSSRDVKMRTPSYYFVYKQEIQAIQEEEQALA